MVRRSIIAVFAGASLVVMAASVSALTPVKVLGGPTDQYRPTSNGTHLAWTLYAHRHNDVYVKRLGSSGQTRVNASGTGAALGSFVGATDKLIYGQWKPRGDSDLYFYDVSSRTRTKAPPVVNTRKWEWFPLASSNYILFLRDTISNAGRVVNTALLRFDRTKGTLKTVIADVGRKSVFPGSAGTDNVAWSVCGSTCNSYIWNGSTKTTRKIPLPNGKAQYAPTIDESDGQVYFVRSGLKCGRGVTIRRAPLSSLGSSSTVASLPTGIDTDWSMSVATNPSTSNQDLYFGRWNCAQEQTDVYVIRDANTA